MYSIEEVRRVFKDRIESHALITAVGRPLHKASVNGTELEVIRSTFPFDNKTNIKQNVDAMVSVIEDAIENVADVVATFGVSNKFRAVILNHNFITVQDDLGRTEVYCDFEFFVTMHDAAVTYEKSFVGANSSQHRFKARVDAESNVLMYANSGLPCADFNFMECLHAESGLAEFNAYDMIDLINPYLGLNSKDAELVHEHLASISRLLTVEMDDESRKRRDDSEISEEELEEALDSWLDPESGSDIEDFDSDLEDLMGRKVQQSESDLPNEN